MRESYTVERHEFGFLVRGPVPVSEFCALTRQWAKDYPGALVDSAIANKLGANFAVVAPEKQNAWRAALGLPAVEPKPTKAKHS